MSEGRELACALHFQLEAAVQLVGALGGSILVVRSTGETAQDLLKTLGMDGATGNVAIQSSAAADEIGLTAVQQQQNSRHHRRTTSATTPRRTPTTDMLELRSALDHSPVPTSSSSVAQFRCIALSGRTTHRAFAHESMLTGVVESGLALNITLAAEPFLAVPIGSGAGSCLGVLCLAYKANPQRLQFDGEDESVALACSRMIAATLSRCAAAKYVTPYDINRLNHLGLHTILAPEVTPMDLQSAPSSSAPLYARGLVYRSSSRAVLATRVERLHGEDIPTLPSLLELAQVMKDLEAMLLKQQGGVNRQMETQYGLEKRLRGVQHELTTLQLTAARDKSEGEAFRLSGQMLQQQLNSRIAHTEIAKLHQSEIQTSVNAEVLGFLDQAKALLDRQTAVSSYRNEPRSTQPLGRKAGTFRPPATTASSSSIHFPAPPPVVPPSTSVRIARPHINHAAKDMMGIQRPRTGGSLKMRLPSA
ncbi:Hypothetical protein, putative [Bodo saltans]|uniref:Uncharacterized protein n=1 Tax=Bodo saltans TaxID=75058 RepID=A0A0S4J2I8_BODSA|nr:Hypothetical protein, putative [Bodo saltans]|eukprot:CUG84235.1 Hypothetical protein, putative [Bodo saltans]